MFITGCHRSGTSLITSIFKDLINDANDESKLVTPQLDNPPGFFESKRLVDFNEKLLQEIGATCSSPPITPPIWTDPPLIDILVNARKDFKDLAISSNWIDKDPRLCLLYPAYFHILLKRVPLIVCMREPINVAVSLFARNGYSINLGLSMWFIYNHHISKFLTENDSFYFYEEFLNASGPDSVIDIYEQCCKTIEPITTQIPSFDKFKQIIKKRVKVNLNRCSSLTSALNENICDLELLNICNDAYQKFHSSQKDLNIYQESFFSIPSSVLKIFYIEKKLSIPYSDSELNDLRNCYKDLEVELERNKESYKNLEVELESYKNLEVELERNKEVLHTIKNTFSWKLTYPLRYLKIKLSSLFK